MSFKRFFAALAAVLALASCGQKQQFEKKARILVVVDLQRDFFNPEGALYVQGSEVLPEQIATLAGIYDAVILTMDWHPGNHCSFIPACGQWPVHCVQYTQGGGLPDQFAIMLRDDKTRARVFLKGCNKDKEEYGAFESLDDYPEIAYWFDNCKQVDVCGIAGDYCVKETTYNIIKYVHEEKVRVLKEYTRSIDGGAALDQFIEERGLNGKKKK